MSPCADTKVAYAERRVGASSRTPRWLLKFCAMFFANSFSDRDKNWLNQCERIVERRVFRGGVKRTEAAFGGGRSQHFLFVFSADDDAV